MELNEVVLSELPDDTIYHLLTVCDIEQVLRFRRVLGKQRAPVFAQVEKFFQQKYGLEGLSLTQIYSIVSKEDKEESALTALALGDFPEYIESIYDEIKLHGQVKRHRHESKIFKGYYYTEDHAIDRIYEYAWYNNREESVLIMFKRKPDPVGDRSIFGIMNKRYRKLLLYMIENYDFSSIVIDDTIVFSKGVPSREALLWALETANPTVSEKLITHILSNRADPGTRYDEVLHLELMEALLERASDEDVRIAYRKHLEGPKLYQDEEVTELFQERLEE